MYDGIRRIHLVVRVDVVVESELGVEEVVPVADVIDDAQLGIPVDVVRRSVHLDADVAILQVDEAVQTRQQVVRHLAVQVEVHLARLVVIVLVVRYQLVDGSLHPLDVAEVAANVAVPAAADGCLQVAVVVIVDGRHGPVEVVVHLLLAHQVALGPRLGVVQVVLVERAFGLILIVVAVALRIVEGRVQAEAVA